MAPNREEIEIPKPNDDGELIVKSCNRLRNSQAKVYSEQEMKQAMDNKDKNIKGLQHNLDVIESELSQIQEAQCSKGAWDRVCLALEFAERG